MRADYTRIIVVIVGFYITQIVMQRFLSMLGLQGITYVIIYNFFLSFVAALIYYPSINRKEAFKEPGFYKTAAVFFLVFLTLSVIRMY